MKSVLFGRASRGLRRSLKLFFCLCLPLLFAFATPTAAQQVGFTQRGASIDEATQYGRKGGKILAEVASNPLTPTLENTVITLEIVASGSTATRGVDYEMSSLECTVGVANICHIPFTVKYTDNCELDETVVLRITDLSSGDDIDPARNTFTITILEALDDSARIPGNYRGSRYAREKCTADGIDWSQNNTPLSQGTNLKSQDDQDNLHVEQGGTSDSTDSGNTQLADYSALKATVRGYADETQHGADHVSRWKRALAGLGDGDAIAEGYTPMTADEAQDMADAYTASRWNPIVEALTDLESRHAAEPEPEPDPPPPPPAPELSLSAGSAVDEGGGASFTIHADAAPASDVTVSVTVAQSGDWLASPGAGTRTVTLAAGATSASLAVATVNDSADEPDGSVSVTLDSGAGYTVASSPNDTASVAVRDDDDPPAAIVIGACVSVAQWDTVNGYYDSNANRSPNYGVNWYRVLIAYHRDRTDRTMPAWTGSTTEPATAFTAKEAEDEEAVWSGWTPVREVLECLEKTYGSSTDSAIGGIPTVGQSGEVGTANPGEARERNRWNPQTAPGGFGPDALPDFAAGSCVSPRLRSEAAARAGETWRGAAHVERWLRVAQTFTGGANDATVVTPAEANFHAAAGQPGWLPVADALRCMEQQSLREAMSR